MRIDSNSAYDREEEAKRKWNYRYTMISIIAVLMIVVAAMVVWNNDEDRLARYNNEGNIKNDNGTNNRLIGEGGLNVTQPIPTVDSKDSPSPPAQPKKKAGAAGGQISPVEGGTISKAYSGNDLIYSVTLDQYIVHSGIDIEAAPDTPVKAVKGGTITRVYNDDKMGITIEVSHGNGYVSRYCNLSTDRMVGEGDVVEAGDIISGVGITALFESGDPPHLHFEVLKDGNAVDPSEFVKF